MMSIIRIGSVSGLTVEAVLNLLLRTVTSPSTISRLIKTKRSSIKEKEN